MFPHVSLQNAFVPDVAGGATESTREAGRRARSTRRPSFDHHGDLDGDC